MIDFSKLTKAYADGHEIKTLFLDGHEVPFGEEAPKYFTVTSLGQIAAASIIGSGSPPAFSLEYSTDGDMWSSYSPAQTITLAAGKSVMFRRVGNATTTFSSGTSNYWRFTFSGANVKVSGNIMSLLDTSMESTTVEAYAFYRLFNGCTSLVDASELKLPAMTLAYSCYTNMFNGCTSLTTAPALPATTLANNCYGYMFQSCTSLTTAPALPATTLAGYCYFYMFNGCTSLSAAPALPATTLANNCYREMFSNCTSLTTAPELPATTLANNCYQGMLGGCTSLTTAPALPATTLANNCYAYMFYSSSSLSAIDVKFTTWSPSSAIDNWLFGVAATGTFTCPSALGTNATIQRGASYCPTGWTVVNYDA